MRHFLITLGTAAAVVAAFLLLRTASPREASPHDPIVPASTTVKEPLREDPPPANGGGPATVTGLPELEVLHRRHGAVGASMRSFLASARGNDWNQVDRTRITELIHAVRNDATEADIAYLIDLFNRTDDKAFRWWFSWLVHQIPDERFVEAMTTVYQIDPHRGIDALAAITSPAALDRYLRLMDGEADPAVRRHAVIALAHSNWEKREELITAIARDANRAPVERVEALAGLGRVGLTADSIAFLMDVALGPAAPAKDLDPKSYPIQDVRAGAILAVMQRGDQESVRRLLEAADAAGIESDLAKMVDVHVASFQGPDLSEFLYDRARRRGYLSAGEVHHLVRDLEHVDRARLRDLVPLVREAEARALLERIVSGN